MKFWRLTLLTTVLFFAVGTTIIYTACEKEPCNNVTCFNGGSCGNGICHCPTGYENTQCQTKAVTRYIGTYAGYISCNNSAQVIDSARIYADSTSNSTINYVFVALKSLAPKVLRGYVYNNESTYSIVIPNEVTTNDLKIYTITLQNYGNSSNNKLSISTYEKLTTQSDTIMTQCSFLGFKH